MSPTRRRKLRSKPIPDPLPCSGRPASSSPTELYRFGLEQLANITARIDHGPDRDRDNDVQRHGAGQGAGDYTYSGVAIEGIKDGKIASMKTDGFHFRFDQPAGKAKQVTGDLAANIVLNDVDVGALAAVFDQEQSQ